jgi:hypothetical protein
MGALRVEGNIVATSSNGVPYAESAHTAATSFHSVSSMNWFHLNNPFVTGISMARGEMLTFKGLTIKFVSHFNKSETTIYKGTTELVKTGGFFSNSLTKSFSSATPTKFERITQCR